MFQRLRTLKSKPDTRTYKFEVMDESHVTNLLNSITSLEGSFGFEWLKTQHKSEKFLFLPQFHTYMSSFSTFKTVLPLDIEYYVFSAVSTKSSCFPFNLEYEQNIIDALDRYLKIQGEIVFAQMILQRQAANWNEPFVQQYKDYLKGVNPNFVTSNQTIRSLQFSVMNYLSSKSKWFQINENVDIDGVMKKLSEDGFKTCIRFVIYANKEQSGKIAKSIEIILRDMDYANNWRLIRDVNSIASLEQIMLRKLPILHKEQILSASELMPFFCRREIVHEETVPELITSPMTVEPTEEEIIPVRISFKLPSLEHLPKGDVVNRAAEKDMNKLEEKINVTLERIGFLNGKKIKVVSSKSAATVNKITFSLPSGINFSSFTESVIKNVRSHLGKSTSITMGDEPNTVAMTIPLEKRRKIYLRDLIESEVFLEFAKKNPLPIIMGINMDGELVLGCLTKMPHLLEAGATGSGKSVWMNCVLLTLLLTKTPNEVSIYLIDPKKVEFPIFKGFPHVGNKVITEPDEAVDLLQSLTIEMDTRYDMISKAGCRNILQYNQKSKNPLKYLVCMIDEYNDLAMRSANEARDSIMRLGQLARACGIHLIIGTQRPSVEVIDGDIKAQLPVRVALKCAQSTDYRTILDSKPPYDLLGNGDGVVAGLQGTDGLVRFQGAMIADNDEDQANVIEDVKSEWMSIMKGVFHQPEALPEIKKNPTPTQIERAKFLICEEKKITQQSLAKLLKTRKENVKPIFDELVAENWIAEPTNNRSGYQVTVSPKEIETFGIWFRETFGSEFLEI